MFALFSLRLPRDHAAPGQTPNTKMDPLLQLLSQSFATSHPTMLKVCKQLEIFFRVLLVPCSRSWLEFF